MWRAGVISGLALILLGGVVRSPGVGVGVNSGSIGGDGVPPEAPTSPAAVAGEELNTITWTDGVGATSHNIYWDTTSPVTTSDTKITGETSPYSHTSLTGGTTYYYAIEAENDSGVSDLSSEVSATPTGVVTFDNDMGSSAGVDALIAAASITINSETQTPAYLYEMGDCDATSCTATTYGGAVEASGSGGTFNDGAPGLGASDDSYQSDGTRYYEDTDGGTNGDVTTQDVVWEIVYKASDGTSTSQMIDKRSGAGVGYVIFNHTTGLRLIMNDGSPNTIVVTAAVQPDAVWHVAHIIVDRSGSAQIYTQGLADGAAVDFSSNSRQHHQLPGPDAGR